MEIMEAERTRASKQIDQKHIEKKKLKRSPTAQGELWVTKKCHVEERGRYSDIGEKLLSLMELMTRTVKARRLLGINV